MVGRWQVRASKKLISNRWLTVRRDECCTGCGRDVPDYYVIEKEDFAMAVALTEGNQLVLVRQYKHGCGDIILECPAGYLNANEDAADAVRRELREETGYSANEVIDLGTFFSSPSILNNRAHFFLCRNVVFDGPQQLDPNEEIDVELVDLVKVMNGIADGTSGLDMASSLAVSLSWNRLSGVLKGR